MAGSSVVDDRTVKCIFHAIAVRNEARSGLYGRAHIRARIVELIEEGFWNESQIASIVGYQRHSVSRLVRTGKAKRPQDRPDGGTLDAASLDIILHVEQLNRAGKIVPAEVIRELIQRGTGTRLLAKLTGVSLGTFLYHQRVLKKEPTTGVQVDSKVDAPV